jgi:hypothetical protein
MDNATKKLCILDDMDEFAARGELLLASQTVELLAKFVKQFIQSHASMVGELQAVLPFYRDILLYMPWLPPQMCKAMKVVISGSVRKYNHQILRKEAATLRALVEVAEARMRENGEQPQGGVKAAAIEEVANRVKLNADTLKKRIQRRK